MSYPYNDSSKSLEEINLEIEHQLLHEMDHPPEEKKKRRAIYSFAGLISFGFLAKMIYSIVQLYM